MQNIHWFQPLKCEDLLFEFLTVGLRKHAIWFDLIFISVY